MKEVIQITHYVSQGLLTYYILYTAGGMSDVVGHTFIPPVYYTQVV